MLFIIFGMLVMAVALCTLKNILVLVSYWRKIVYAYSLVGFDCGIGGFLLCVVLYTLLPYTMKPFLHWNITYISVPPSFMFLL